MLVAQSKNYLDLDRKPLQMLYSNYLFFYQSLGNTHKLLQWFLDQNSDRYWCSRQIAEQLYDTATPTELISAINATATTEKRGRGWRLAESQTW